MVYIDVLYVNCLGATRILGGGGGGGGGKCPSCLHGLNPGKTVFMCHVKLCCTTSPVIHTVLLHIGLFENYLLARVRDPNLEAMSVAQDWLVFHDHFLSHIGHTQDYLFLSYLPFLSVAFHFLFASSSKANLKYPNTGYEVWLSMCTCPYIPKCNRVRSA